MSNVPFISWLGHGAASLAPSGVFTDAKANAFVIDADTKAMQRTVDTLLNPAGAGRVRYQVALPVAMLSFMDIAQCTSSTDILGWLPGRECAIWIPLLEFRDGHLLPSRLVFWSPYIFISYTIGMVTGREAWGWPKVLAEIGVASDTPANPQFSCTTTFFPTMAATTKGEHGVLYRIVQQQAAAQQPPVWQSAGEARAGLIDGIFGGLAGDLLDALQPQLPSVVLKQFRAAGAPQSACFQAIVDSPIEMTRFIGGGLLWDTFSLEITNCESHAIVYDLLGYKPAPGTTTTLPVKFATWVTVDFQALTGDDIVVTT